MSSTVRYVPSISISLLDLRITGHAGDETVDHSVKTLPRLIEASLTAALTNANHQELPPSAISEILVNAISAFDNAISSDLLDLFPGGPDTISELSDDEIRAIINDAHTGGRNSAKLMRCMRGSTALVALVDPSETNLWVASLGDCQAGSIGRFNACIYPHIIQIPVLGLKDSTGEWKASLLSSNHNGMDETEANRVRREHPGENECILRDRVLGAIAVTRGISVSCRDLSR